jgi:hypothetical protein
MQSIKNYSQLLQTSSRVLPLVIKNVSSEYAPAHEHFAKKHDLIIAYKLSSLLDAANALEAIPNPDFEVDKQKIVEDLLALRLPASGWPDYKSDDEWQNANTHASAVALLALSKGAVSDKTKQACLETLGWFCEQPLEKQSIATLSMVVIALNNLSKNADTASDFRQPRLVELRDRCEGLVRVWIQGNSPDDVQRSLEGTEYWLPPGAASSQSAGGVHFTFLLYLPHILASLAVLASSRLRSCYAARQFVVGIIDRVTREINAQGCFIAAGRSMVSTVEHLWLYRLLYQFERCRLHSNWIVAAVDRVRHFATRRWLVTLLIASLTVALVIFAAITSGKIQLALSAVSALIVTILATAIAALLSNRWKD